MTRTTLGEECLTDEMTEVRLSERSGLATGRAADSGSDAPMHMGMEMATAVTSIDADTAREDTTEQMV